MRKNKKAKKISLLFAVVICGLILFAVTGEKSSAANQGWVGQILNPVHGYLLKVTDTLADVFSGLLNSENLKKENEKLLIQNQTLKSILNGYVEIKAENEALREALKIKSRQNLDFILADVISRSPLNFSQSFTINQGTSGEIKVGQAVIWAGQVLVGEVRDVAFDSSEIRAASDGEFRAAVFVGESRTEAVFKGNGLEPAQLDLVPAKVNISVGDRIITSGLDKKFPRGLYLGEVKRVKNLEGKVFQEVEVELPFHWNELEEVLIIR